MFYIDNFKRRKRFSMALPHLIPAGIIFFAFAGLSLWSWQTAKNAVRDDRQQAQSKNIDDVTSAIDNRIKTYEEVLRAGSSIFGASESVNRSEWAKFAEIFDLPNRYPGIQGIGYAKVLTPATRDAFVAAVRSNDDPNFTVNPPTNEAQQVSLLYFAPLNTPYPPSSGYDIYSDPARKAAMDKARDTSNPTLTERILLLRDTEEDKNASFIMYFPVYSGGIVPADVGTRRSQLSGFVYAPFRANMLFGSLDSSDENSSYGYRVYAGEPDSKNLLYQSHAYEKIQQSGSDPTPENIPLKFGENTWTIEFNRSQSLGSEELRKRPTGVLWGGALFSLLAASLIYVLLASRARALSYADDIEIQEAKDELLALASHQLRTPATGVKQYIGMLREGFVGELTEQQLNILNKAHESNERQLLTISEMLSVARADSGRLLLEKSRLNIGRMLSDIVAEQKKAIEQQSQTITLVLPKKPVYTEVDPQYTRMAIENILNNANKYTPVGGAINIRLRRTKEGIEIQVEDTGVGVEERDYPLLFKKFSRIPNELTNKVSGSGIGLYLAKSIIEAHGGYINFTSKSGVGSVFVIGLPAQKKKITTKSKR